MRPLGIPDIQKCIRMYLEPLKMWSLGAENLLIGTAVQESHLGKWLEQMEDGPAVGIFQMEPRTYKDILKNVVPAFVKHTGLSKDDFPKNAEILKYDIRLAIISARYYYARFKEKLPHCTDIYGQARYWKKYWNTEKGAGTEDQYIENVARVMKVFRVSLED